MSTPTPSTWNDELHLTGHWLSGGRYLWYDSEYQRWYLQPMCCGPYDTDAGAGAPEHLELVRAGKWRELGEALDIDDADPSPYDTLPHLNEMARLVFLHWWKGRTGAADYDSTPFEYSTDTLADILDEYEVYGDRVELERARAAILEEAEEYRRRYLEAGQRERRHLVHDLARGLL